MYQILKPFAFAMDPENAHDRVIQFCSKNSHWAKFLGRNESNLDLSLQVGSNRWAFPVGLAAGLDKNGTCIDFFSELGFGAIEVGTVTPLAQEGNPKPRLFRYIEEESLRNCMGFNNQGAEFMALNMAKKKSYWSPVGVNIGKNKLTPDNIAFEDYAKLYNQFKESADYIVINVSSPNTPGLRDHQSKEGLREIVGNLKRERGEVDVFVKISPDVAHESVDDAIEVVKEFSLTGIIATNTTIMPERGVGGVSGRLLHDKAQTIRKKCLDSLRETPEINFIGVGGFSNFDQIMDFWKQGGRAVQIYSSFIFQGPQILIDIQNSLEELMNQRGLKSFEELLAEIRNN